MPRPIISPSVLASDFGQLTTECERMIKGGAEWLHIDVMDGHFVPNITIGCSYSGRSSNSLTPLQQVHLYLSCVARSIPGIFMDCHMSVEHPENRVSDIAAAGGSLFCFHIETTSDPLSLIMAIHDKDMKAGVAISLDIPSAAITDEIGAAADMLLVMTVYPGCGGQKFLDRCVPKIAELRARFPTKDIEVDGGIGPMTVHSCTEAGGNVMVAGTAIFLADNLEEVIMTLKNAVVTAQANHST